MLVKISPRGMHYHKLDCKAAQPEGCIPSNAYDYVTTTLKEARAKGYKPCICFCEKRK